MKPLTETLRDRNEIRLESIGFVPGLAQKMTARQRRRIVDLLGERAVIEDLATTQGQREAYGIERWHRAFVRLRDIHTDQHFDKFEGEELQWYIWDKAQGCRFTQFQELFCAPPNFILPRFTLDRRGNVEFHGLPDWHSLSLAPCLVSADRIPDKLMEDLGLCTFEEENGDPMARLTKKRALIPRFKLLWEAAVPLQQRQQRMLAIAPPTPEVQSRYHGIEEPPSSAIGTILYTRGKESGFNANGTPRRARGAPRPPRSLVTQYFVSAYRADRKTFHEFHVYAREITQLTDAKQALRSINSALDAARGLPETEQTALEEHAKKVLLHHCSILSTSAHRLKVEAHDLLQSIVDLKDRIGRKNISAAMAKMVAVMTLLEARILDLTPKGGYNHQDQTILERCIQEHERTLQAFRTGIARKPPELFAASALFTGQPMSVSEVDREVGSLEAHLGTRPDPLQTIILEPFRTYALRLRQKSLTLDAALRSRDRERAMDTVIEMHLIGKFQDMRRCFEDMKQCLIQMHPVPLSQIQLIARELRIHFTDRQLFPARTVAAYAEPFVHMEQVLGKIERGLQHYAVRHLDVGEQAALYGRIKKYLETFDLEEIVRGLR